MKENLKQLKDLTEKHYPVEQAHKIAEQLHNAQELADKSVVAAPEKSVLESIKADIASELNKSRFTSRKWVYSAIAAAACIVIVITAAIKFQTADLAPPSEPAATTAAVETVEAREILVMSWDYQDEDNFLENELRSIEFAVYDSDQDYQSIDYYIINIENEISQMQEIFWKG